MTYEPYVKNIEQETANNNNFRTVLNTAAHSQLVVMSLKAGEEIGMEVHPNVDQFLRIESGEGKAILNGQEYALSDGFAVVVPAGTNHNIINTGSGEMKLYTIYSPANHPVGTIHATKADADAAEMAENH
jgi:mannose-6-phosphate isomerase-like protein (cupin superfamily)